MAKYTSGSSGNPGGRPKSFANLIREQTRDGDEMVAFALAVMRGLPNEAGTLPKFIERIEALKWLGDRGWGKAVQSVELSGEGGAPLVVEIRKFTPEE